MVGGAQTTGADGIARVDSWTVGDRPGANTLTATSAEVVNSTISFSATAAKGAIVEVRNNYFRSRENGSGSPITETDILGKAAVDRIRPGQTVTWVWVGQGHNVSQGNLAAETHNAPHTSSFTFDSPGTYFYRCTNHSFIAPYFFDLAGMRGEIVVR